MAAADRQLPTTWSSLADRVAADLRRHPDDPDLQALHAHVAQAAAGTGREVRGSTRVICPRFRIDGQVVRTLTVAARFESAADVTLDELRVELIYPADDASERFFRDRRPSDS